LIGVLGAIALGELLAGWSPAIAQGTACTYQGTLAQNGFPAHGAYDLVFSLFDTDAAGNVVAGPLTNTPVLVTNGLFTLLLDFGPSAFDGSARWLEIGVRTNRSSGPYTLLAPRQPVSATPYALSSLTALDALHAGTATNAIFAATSTNAFTARLASSALTAGTALYAGAAAEAITARFATNATFAAVATNALTARLASSALTAGNALYAGTATKALTAGLATNAIFAATATNAFTATLARSALTAGSALYAGTATKALGGWPSEWPAASVTNSPWLSAPSNNVPVMLAYSGTNVAVNATLGSHFRLTATNSFLLENPTGASDAQRLLFEIIQDASGGRTMSFGSAYRFGTDLPVVNLTTNSNLRDFITCVCSGTNCYVVGFMKGF